MKKKEEKEEEEEEKKKEEEEEEEKGMRKGGLYVNWVLFFEPSKSWHD